MNLLLDRDTFRPATFKRDKDVCVMCGRGHADGVKLDAHHIMERRLFTAPSQFGGYYLENGATLCDDGTPNSCHFKAEMTLISPEELREKIGIKKAILPEHLYPDQRYTKWGDEVLPSGKRIRGELFNDESVQKVLEMGGVLNLYSPYVKYPRTYHLSFSPGFSSDDRVMKNHDCFVGKNVIVTAKMDGENTTLYHDYVHARSIDSRTDVTRHWVQNFHAGMAHEIPEGWRVCAENLYAAHTIKYSKLPSYLLGISVWNEKNVCLSWDETIQWLDLLGIKPLTAYCPPLYVGPWNEKIIRDLYRSDINGEPCEGFVVRLTDSFHYSQFRYSVAKYVDGSFRRKHNENMDDSRNKPIERNQVLK